MALTDPQSVTVGGSAVPLARTVTNPTNALYSSSDGLTTLQVSHQRGTNVTSSLIKLEVKKLSDPANVKSPLIPLSAHTVVKAPLAGFTTADKVALVKSLQAALTASTDALLTKFVNLES